MRVSYTEKKGFLCKKDVDKFIDIPDRKAVVDGMLYDTSEAKLISYCYSPVGYADVVFSFKSWDFIYMTKNNNFFRYYYGQDGYNFIKPVNKDCVYSEYNDSEEKNRFIESKELYKILGIKEA